MQFQDHDEFPEFDHPALPPARGRSIGDSARRPSIPCMPGMAGRHENWGFFNRHFCGVYARHSQPSALDVPFHTDLGLMAQRRRGLLLRHHTPPNPTRSLPFRR